MLMQPLNFRNATLVTYQPSFKYTHFIVIYIFYASIYGKSFLECIGVLCSDSGILHRLELISPSGILLINPVFQSSLEPPNCG